MSTDSFEEELDAPLLLNRLAAIDLNDQQAVDFELTTHPISSRKLVEGTTAPSVGFEELLSCSGAQPHARDIYERVVFVKVGEV